MEVRPDSATWPEIHGQAEIPSSSATASGSPEAGSTPASRQMVACQSTMWRRPSWTLPACVRGRSPPVTNEGTRVPPSQLDPFPPRSGWLDPPTETGEPLSCRGESVQSGTTSDRKRQSVTAQSQSQHSHSTVTEQSVTQHRAQHRIASANQSEHSQSTVTAQSQHSQRTVTAQSQHSQSYSIVRSIGRNIGWQAPIRPDQHGH